MIADQMETIKTIVEQIRRIQNSNVDVGILQGNKEIIDQFKRQCYQVDELAVPSMVQEAQDDIVNLKQKMLPYKIPEDYLYFLEYYGGLMIADNYHYFAPYGLGPMSEEWYASIISPDATPEAIQYGFLGIGFLSLREGKYQGQNVSYFLDIAGKIQSGTIIAIGPRKPATSSLSEVLKDIFAFPTAWQKIANSFTEWLQLVLDTEGVFDYK